MRRKALVTDISLIIAFALALTAAVVTSPAKVAARPSQPPPATLPGGLVHTPGARVQLAYVLPGTNWAKYKTIQLHALSIPPDVRDARGSNRPRHRESFLLGDSEVAALQTAYTDSMKRVFTDAGFTFVDKPQNDTLVIAAQILDIRLTAPLEQSRTGYAGRSRTYTQGAGSMKIGAVLADGQTGQVVAQVADARAANSSFWRINNRVTNLADARQIFGDWARRLRDTLR